MYIRMGLFCLCSYSPDQRLIAVSLLDNTVKVFFADTLKVCNQSLWRITLSWNFFSGVSLL